MLESFEGRRPNVHTSAWVHESACLIGQVELGPDVTVWPTAVLRGDMGLVRVGARSNIQDGAVCHDTDGVSQTIIGERVTVGHRAILHGCIVEDDCLIGMGAIVMDNVRVGAGSLIAAGTVIPPGRIIPPGSMVRGVPGKVAGSISKAQEEWIAYSWRIYVEKGRKWRHKRRMEAAR